MTNGVNCRSTSAGLVCKLIRASRVRRHVEGFGDDLDKVAGLHLYCEKRQTVLSRRRAFDIQDGATSTPGLGSRNAKVVQISAAYAALSGGRSKIEQSVSAAPVDCQG